ncbi:hypothetical protein A3D78_02165 [Candidatus Gottesmanbacteria bacterium RIFCSPHIGHO2_02_FULL_39_14]|uniref:General secretion pathway GspH domain-containing protein n=1 Tax=Candidatus Gottesmanbacteria bacterium RIFCSPHIGHO2_02_FULL_39_14 TaxID=1798383 RepID=A0A1F6A3D8_9BACT|nr:MAG: hypothetical protein A3D78_02165 [Candidatus Gottesmanbacteria bacterium RIFCSPHIGHO2_02_FULL_39_14]
MKLRGFTLIEVVIVIAFLMTLLGLVLASSINFRISTDVNSEVNKLITDIKNQQIKAMTGDTEGSLIVDSSGINFSQTKYTMFHGDTYTPANPTNFDVELESNLKIINTFPNNTIIFSLKSGEIASFTPGSDSITIQDAANSVSRTIKLNKYGSITDFYKN